MFSSQGTQKMLSNKIITFIVTTIQVQVQRIEFTRGILLWPNVVKVLLIILPLPSLSSILYGEFVTIVVAFPTQAPQISCRRFRPIFQSTQ